ncbi:hypothetical protein MAM1_0112d05587 [Mucor ambiguus]|uniref:FHA domain-containing protein n=1 Tax=Mucor ambiguus TaxID=91626 RepID=A0A0C9LV40_9FUNG|nr:hypothetical protein MAM1_0112d05587 [Mucor ambiguus]
MSTSIANASFNDSELSKGYHLLTESAHTVKVNTPSVPPNTAHRYPRLAGSNWTCYISEPRIVIGRSATVTPGQKRARKEQLVHVDFVDSNTVSRRHCEIRFSARRERWELYVYGRNGVKINHVDKKPRDKPTVLKTGSLIEINDTTFVFILPDNFIQPRYPSQRVDDDGAEEPEITTPSDHHDIGVDQELELAIVALFNKAHTDLNTNDIMAELKKIYNKPIEKETLLHMLVIHPNFHLSPDSIAMSLEESDQAKWSHIPASTSDHATTAATQKQHNGVTEPGIVTESTSNNHELSNEPTTTEKSSQLPPALLPSVSLSRLFNDGMDDGDWSVFMPDPPLDQPSQENSQQPAVAAAVTTEEESRALDQPSSLEAAPSLEEPSSLEWDNGTTPDRYNDHHNEATHPSSPQVNYATQEDQEEEPSTTLPANAPPALFRGLSIESMYSLWTSSTSSLFAFEDNLADDGSPNKRLKHTGGDGLTCSNNNSSNTTTGTETKDDSTATGIIQTNIYKEIHTRILI